MPFETIQKDPATFRVPPNFTFYEEERANFFSWERAVRARRSARWRVEHRVRGS
jgi:hypothetical protein